MDALGKPNPKFEKKIEQMKKQNYKSQAREASFNWRSHVPVYGWTTINYPTSIQRPLREKYKEESEIYKEEKRIKEEKERIEKEEQKKLELEKKTESNVENTFTQKKDKIKSRFN